MVTSELKTFVDRIDHILDDKESLMDGLKEVKAEAKSHGFDVKVLMKVVALRRRDPDDLSEEEAILQLYRDALEV